MIRKIRKELFFVLLGGICCIGFFCFVGILNFFCVWLVVVLKKNAFWT